MRKTHQITLEDRLKDIYESIDSNDEVDIHLEEEKEIIEGLLREIDNYKTESLIIQSRCRWYEQGEKSTKYFLNLVKRNKTRTTMTKLQRDNGDITTDMKEILKAQMEFYQTLYSETSSKTVDDIKTYLQDVNINKVNDDDRLICDKDFTAIEIEKATKTFKKNKTPGSDGLTVEFYIKFWNTIKTPLVKCFNKSFREGELSGTQKEGIITLLDKGKDKTLLKNWRPITLLNIDYKILTKTIALRIKNNNPSDNTS